MTLVIDHPLTSMRCCRWFELKNLLTPASFLRLYQVDNASLPLACKTQASVGEAGNSD